MSTETVITWDELKHLVDTNGILKLRRHPDVLAKYRSYKAELQQDNKSLFSHLIINELEWATPDILDSVQDISKLPELVKLEPQDARLLGNEQDIKILLNDFPYYFEPQVTHLVVWTKVPIKSDPASEMGDISSKTRSIIDRYVTKTFNEFLNISKEDILWFRNWTALQSVRNISHIHVIVRNLTNENFDKIFKKSGIAVNYDVEDSDLDVCEYI